MIKIVNKFEYHFKLLYESIKSIMIVFIFSNYRKNEIHRKSEDCYILGNGPSLLDSYQNLKNCKRSDIYVTNDFARNSIFFELKPNNYVLVDPAFFRTQNPQSIKKRIKEILDNINNVSWSMRIHIPNKFYKHFLDKVFNKNLEIVGFNHYALEGYNSIIFKLFDLGLGMPKVQNVMIACLMLAIKSRYRNIYLYGAEHSWMRYMVLNEKNELCLESHHFFQDEAKMNPWYKSENELFKVSEALEAMALMFRGYEKVKLYSTKFNINIINKTPNSLIDSFQHC